MDKHLLKEKREQLTDRMVEAGDIEELRRLLLKAIVVCRMEAREAMYDLAEAESKQNTFRRMMSAVAHDPTCAIPPISNEYFENLTGKVMLRRWDVAAIGERLALLLDCWQANGASLRDLCVLNNVNFDDIEWRLSPDDYNKPFSLFVPDLALGYKNTYDSLDVRDFLNVPILYALHEYFFSQVASTDGEFEDG